MKLRNNEDSTDDFSLCIRSLERLRENIYKKMNDSGYQHGLPDKFARKDKHYRYFDGQLSGVQQAINVLSELRDKPRKSKRNVVQSPD